MALLLATTLKTTLAIGRGGSTCCVFEQYSPIAQDVGQ